MSENQQLFEINQLLADSQTLKILATVSKQGVAQIDYITDLRVTEDNKLEYLEFNEGARTQKRLFRAIWFDGRVTVTLRGQDGRVLEIEVAPERVHITGSFFQQRYVEVRDSGRSEGLAGVWILKPLSVIDRSPEVLKNHYQLNAPFDRHLDAFAL